ncbi:MOSC domain-containing protein [Neobacillus massiliamazoniensis]|uniref:MOSC domain-containing protein n=1 Tax=Neobacillus massiliamazoniensis TaxID=1499688 RepID=A0A0U1NVL8_9BACI|nr:MOSC domain-containing protein [Neobacillus massiliamazoniensis]CRK82083.1 MOSC domain-containing protein [Neobacillus massiliamazoniensis]
MHILLKKVFVGMPKTVGNKEATNPMEREWTSAIFKEPIEGPIWVGKTGLTGDGQADREHHGGPEKAVFAYPFANYTYWQKELGFDQISSGGMGENFVMNNIIEETISIGDTFQIGEAIVQVAQPRLPCWKPARRFRVKNLALLLQNTGKTGWYYRVLQEGFVEEGQTFTLVERPFLQWTVERCNQIIHSKNQDFEAMQELSECELLAPKFRETLMKRLEKRETPDIRNRVFGPNE